LTVVRARSPALDGAARFGLGLVTASLIALALAVVLPLMGVLILALVSAEGDVDRRAAVAENVSLLREVRPPAGTILTGTRSEPMSSSGDFTRIVAYTTWLSYSAPEGTRAGEVRSHYRRAFDGAGWSFVGATPEDGQCYVLREARACLEPGLYRSALAAFAIKVVAHPVR
jgi:hypothetical protein